MNINQIKYVLRVAASSSMREAATSLFITQPALSSSIRELEDELGISGIRFRLVHGRFLDPLYLSYDSDEKLREGFHFHDGRPDANGMICADSHRPFIRPLEGGYALNTGSIGNNLSMARAHALLLEGEKGPAPLRITILSVPYDNRQAAERANLYPDLPRKEAYQREVLTGIYSR